jgi:hypothetical protein
LLVCTRLLAQADLYGCIIVAAHSRGEIGVALRLFSEPMVNRMTRREIAYLVEQRHSLSFRTNLYRSLSTDEQFVILFPTIQESSLWNNISLSNKLPLQQLSGLCLAACLRTELWPLKKVFIAADYVKQILPVVSRQLEMEMVFPRISLLCLAESMLKILFLCVYHAQRRASHSSVLPMDGMQSLLENMISIYQKCSHTSRIKYKCSYYGNWRCSSIIYQQQKDYYRALTSKLMQLKVQKGLSVPSEDATEILVQLIKTHILTIPPKERNLRTILLRKILLMFLEKTYQVSHFECILLKSMVSLSTEISEMLLDRDCVLGILSKRLLSRKVCFRSCQIFLGKNQLSVNGCNHSKPETLYVTIWHTERKYVI